MLLFAPFPPFEKVPLYIESFGGGWEGGGGDDCVFTQVKGLQSWLPATGLSLSVCTAFTCLLTLSIGPLNLVSSGQEASMYTVHKKSCQTFKFQKYINYGNHLH